MSQNIPQTTQTLQDQTSPNLPRFQKKPEAGGKDITAEELCQRMIGKTLLESMASMIKLPRPLVPDSILAELEKEDLVLGYDVRIISKEGDMIKVAGHVTMCGIAEAGALAEAPEVFQNVFYTSVWQPTRTKFLRKLQESLKAKRVLPALTGGLDDGSNIPRITTTPSSDNLPLANNKADFTLFTDGAGYQDGYGGAASIVASKRYQRLFHRIMCATGTSVDRMEFNALLMGLQSILDEMDWNNKRGLESLTVLPPTVLWFSDRESLVKSVNDEYGRHAQPDLWHHFSWYEQRFNIFGVHVKRDTNHMQNLTDRLASEARILIGDYDKLAQEQQYI